MATHGLTFPEPLPRPKRRCLRVTATYTDGHGPAKEEVSSGTGLVLPSPALNPSVVSAIGREAEPGDVVQSNPISPTNPVQVHVRTPNAGWVAVIVRSNEDMGVTTGFNLEGATFQITAPTASVDDPLELRLLVLTQALPEALAVSKDGVVVSACTGEAQAMPDPCVSDRVTTADRRVLIIGLTTEASNWQVGVPTPPTPEATPDPTPKPASTPVPTPVPAVTQTPAATPTATPEPAAKATPEPTSTLTPEPTATATPKPGPTMAPRGDSTTDPTPTTEPTPTVGQVSTDAPYAFANTHGKSGSF